MQNQHFDPQRWNFVPVQPDASRRFRQTNLVVILILAFLVLGLLVATFDPQLGHVTSPANTFSLLN
jgi:hypothetical protein